MRVKYIQGIISNDIEDRINRACKKLEENSCEVISIRLSTKGNYFDALVVYKENIDD